MSDPLAPCLRVINVQDEALDKEKFTPEVCESYLADYDPKKLEGCFHEGMSPTWFCISQLPGDVLSDQIDAATAASIKYKIAFLNCCHRIEGAGAQLLHEPSATEWASKPKLASVGWWKRMLDEYGSIALYNIAAAIIFRARLPKSKRVVLS
jgi:hypothetical protein